VRRVVGGDGVPVPSRVCEQRFAVLPRRQWRIHLEPRIVPHVFVDQREMMRRDFACDAQPACFGPANLFERRFRGRCAMCRRAPLSLGELHVAPPHKPIPPPPASRANQDELK